MVITLILIILLVLSIILNAVLLFCIVNLLRKFEIYESWIQTFRTEIRIVWNRLRAVDQQNLFDKDDDVGFVFSELVRVMREFDEKVQ
jgi:hypothetical protein